jgi:hypothetical protein
VLLVRAIVFLLLIAAAVLFAMYAGTGQARYKRLGLIILKWTVFAALAFFAGLIIERLL